MRRLAGDLAAAIAATLPLWFVALVGVPGPQDVTLNLGPNDASYLAGFAEHYEIDGDLATRWSSLDAEVDLPYEVRGPASLSWRAARMLPETAAVTVQLDGRTVDGYTCRGGRFETRVRALGPLSGTPLRARFLVDSHEPRGLGLRIDWVRLTAEAGGMLRARGLPRWTPLLFVLAAFGLLRFVGFTTRATLAMCLALAALASGWAWRDLHALTHVATRLAVPALLTAGVAWALVRTRPGGRWAVALVLLSHLVKGAAVFHPAFFYPDVQNHRRYVMRFADFTGTLAERGVAAQKAVNTAYPRYVGGKAYAFPYSPLFFVPFSWMRGLNVQTIEDALRTVGLAAAALEVALVFLLAQAVYGTTAGALAALFAAVLPPLHSRLLYAMWPTVVGHLLDLCAILAAARLVVAPEAAALARFGTCQLAAFLTYISSLFNLGGFAAWLAILDRRLRLRVVAVTAAAALLTIGFLYFDFTRTFVFEIVPALARGGGGGSGGPRLGLGDALARIPLFYGFAFPLLAAAGFLLARASTAFRVLTAYALTFVTLVLLRGLLPGLFRDLKEITFVAPLVAVTAGAAVEELALRSRLAAALVTLGLAGWALARCWSYFAAYDAAVMAVRP